MIYKWDLRYSIAKLFVDSALRLSFSKLTITGKENIPKDVPLIYTPNHRNALIDALLMVYSSPHSKQIVFLGRGDIFKKKFIAWILRGVRIIPVYRIRDGKESLDKNGEIFDIAGEVLKRKNPIGIFPEATHNPKQSLLPIKKAVPRIVLPTEAQLGFGLNSHIIPTSIYYTNIYGFLSECYVHFGKPISVAKYREVYEKNPNVATNQLREELQTEMSKIVVNIWNDEYYDEYNSLIDWNSLSKNKYRDALRICSRLDALYSDSPKLFDEKMKAVEQANKILKEYNIKEDWKARPIKSTANTFLKSVALVISAPIALFGFINNIFPIIIKKRLQSLFKDKQFISSARYVSGLLFIPIFTIIQSLIVQAVFNNWQLALGYAITTPLTFLFAAYWRKWKKSVARQWRINRFFKKHPTIFNKLISLSSL